MDMTITKTFGRREFTMDFDKYRKLVTWFFENDNREENYQNTMDFDKYRKLVTWFLKNDNREENYQNRVLIPFLEGLCKDLDIVDTSMLTKEWDGRGINRKAFAGVYTPDLLVASGWKLKKTETDTVKYKAIVEVKTPTATDRKHAESEIKEYLEKVAFVILTDCVTWKFYMKENDSIYSISYSLGEKYKVHKKLKLKSSKYEFPAQVCERYQTEIKWSDSDWENIEQAIKNFSIKKDNNRITL